MASEDEKEKLLETFKTLDTDGDGVLTIEELKAGFKKSKGIRSGMSDNELRALINEIDTNKSGTINYTGKLKGLI